MNDVWKIDDILLLQNVCKKPARGRLSCVSYTENLKPIECSICGHETDIPNGGINNLPQNFILFKKVKEALVKVGMISCGLCYNEVMVRTNSDIKSGGTKFSKSPKNVL